MSSVTQRIKQYNKDVGQPRGGLINPKRLEVTQFEDEHGSLDQKQENVHSSVVGLAVDYLSRLALRQAGNVGELSLQATDVFRVSLLGAARLGRLGVAPSAHADAVQALLGLTVAEHDDGSVSFALDEIAVFIACQLATYDVGLRAGASMYNPASTLVVPDAQTIMHGSDVGLIDSCPPVLRGWLGGCISWRNTRKSSNRTRSR